MEPQRSTPRQYVQASLQGRLAGLYRTRGRQRHQACLTAQLPLSGPLRQAEGIADRGVQLRQDRAGWVQGSEATS
jgi:hypothetical protein